MIEVITMRGYVPIHSMLLQFNDSNCGFNHLTDVVLARVATEKKHSLIRAWEESEKSKAENKYVLRFLVELLNSIFKNESVIGLWI